MMRGFAGAAQVEETFAEALAITGIDYWRMAAEGPAEALNQTVNTQPLMLVAGVACWRSWRAQGGPMPAWMAGHSLGEYTALVAAEALAFEDALPLVRFRAQAMQEAVPEGQGAMAAILNLDDAGVRAACAEAAQGQVVDAVNFNAPGQIVIAGHKEAVARAMELCKAKGAKRVLPLPVSAPFHSSLMRPAAERLRGYLAKVALAAPACQLINNVDVRVETQPDAIKDALVRQAAAPVRWVETVQQMRAQGVTHVLECGPGKVLAGMVKRIDGSLQSFALSDKASLEQALAAVKGD
jgi:[acyl-carrier-protein] S-malonyltransferase